MQITAKDLMTKKLVTISQKATLDQAEKLMLEKRFRHLPVVDEENCVVGIISDRDVQNFSYAVNTSVEFFMTTPVLYIEQNCPLSTAIYKMLENKISCLIVTVDDDEVGGLITTDDLLLYLASLCNNKPEARLSQGLTPTKMEMAGDIANLISSMGI